MRRPARSALRRPDRAGPAHETLLHPARLGGGATATASCPARLTPAQTAEVNSLLQAALAQHQAGRTAEAEALYRRVLALDPVQADALNLLGVLAYQAGRSEDALPLMERAVQLRPGSPSFQMNLGSALLATGQVDAAIVAYRRVTTRDPANAEAHYNLGNALLQRGDTTAGIASLRRALQLRPDHAAARNNLGNALRTAGQTAEARAAYEAVVQFQPGYADAHGNIGILLHELGEVAAARCHFQRALALQPDHQGALRGLATIEQTDGAFAAAAALLERLALSAPDAADLTHHVILNLQRAGQPDSAFGAIVAGLDRFPDDHQLLRDLIDALQEHTTPIVGSAAQTIRASLLTVATSDQFDAQALARPIANLILSTPEYPGLVAAVRAGVDPLAAGIPLPPALTDEPAVLAALPRAVICLPEIELILTALRRSTLMRHETPTVTPFLCALAGAAFLSEYAWLAQPDEIARMAAIRDEVVTLLANPDSDLVGAQPLLLLAALYDRLGRLPGSERLAEGPADRWNPPFIQIIREQVLETLEERRLAAALPRITPIDDAISQTVQAMYEENPYPRWRATGFKGFESLIERFRFHCPGEPEPDWPTPLPVLIAGAGSGQHPIQVALRMPEADILGVDLSRTSLGYGARMAARIGVSNVRLAQADILALDTLGRQFALIECSGVLHHMDDPMAGWAVLRRLLRPDGLMKISLYSELARQGVVAARALVAAHGFPSAPEGIRAARRLIIDLPPEHPAKQIMVFWDFYSQSGFRDLAMHIQEHRFTIPQLAASLDALDLRFLGFDVKPDVQESFCARFPQAGALLDLDAWEQFEQERPATFATMYHFWCRPR